LNFLIIHRSFNDIDHISPVSYKLLEEGHKIYIFMSEEHLDYKNDYRLKFLESKGAKILSPLKISNLKLLSFIVNSLKYLYVNSSQYYVRKYSFAILSRISKRLYINLNNITELSKIDGFIFDWADVRGKSNINLIYNYAKKNNKITFSLPHASDIYSNFDIVANQNSNEKDFRNEFDYVITNQFLHSQKMLKRGLESKKISVIGSGRFCNEWSNINKKLLENQKIINKTGKKIITFMPQHSQYNIDKEKQVSLIKKISDLNKYILYFKPHTRNQNESYFKEIENLENVIIDTKSNSVNLIEISDAIIVYGSSIVIEATLQKKIVLYPKFLHSNTTIFEDVGACEIFKTEKEFIKYLKNGLTKSYSEIEEQKFLELSANPNKSDNILQDYVDFIVSKIKKVN
jgi:hypothetical protein